MPFRRRLAKGALWGSALWALGLILGLLAPGCSQAIPPGDGPSEAPLDAGQIAQALRDTGWEGEAAQKVAELNLRYLGIVREYDPEGYRRHLAVLGRLGAPRYRGVVQSRLVECPELASLLAESAGVEADGPQQIAQSIPSDIRQRQSVLGLYMLYADADDAVNLAHLLNGEGELVLRLHDRGAWAAFR